MKPMELNAPCKDYLWGGKRLREFGKVSDKDKIAESWELSCHPDGESIIAGGEFAGMTLTAFLKAHPETLGARAARFDRFPVLIKLIDAKDNLSVQVHPDNEYALRVEGEYGKTEMWYIVDAEEGAQLIYGFAREITREEFRRAIEENTLLDAVRQVSVHPGDVFFIPAGTLHAIGRGILIAEVQQNSNTTYRVYDYGRVGADGKPRALHVDKALEVTDLTPIPDRAPAPVQQEDGHTRQTLGVCDYFDVTKLCVKTRAELPAGDAFRHLLVLEGEGTLTGEGVEIALRPGTSVFLPADASCTVEGHCTAILTTV